MPKYIIFKTFSLFIALTILSHVAYSQDVVSYKVFQIKSTVNEKKWDTLSFVSCVIVQDIKKLQLTIYKGDKKLIYSGYSVEAPVDKPGIGTVYLMKAIDNLGQECTIQQIMWNGNLTGTATFAIRYKKLFYTYDADLVKPFQ